jgi:hypothetical protein
MESLSEINKALKLVQLNEVNKCLKCYGIILKDITVEKTNKRYTIVRYKDYYFRIVVQNGETIEIEKSKNQLDIF